MSRLNKAGDNSHPSRVNRGRLLGGDNPESLKRQDEQAEWGWRIVVPRDELRMREGRGTRPPKSNSKGCAQNVSRNFCQSMKLPVFCPHISL